MNHFITATYVLCDDFLKSHGVPPGWPNEKTSLSEVMMVALDAARHHQGNITASRNALRENGYFPRLVSVSQIIKRLDRLDSSFWNEFLQFCYSQAPKRGLTQDFLVDTFPIRICHNIRIAHSRICRGKAFHGFTASKREYFYGVKLSLITTAERQPYQFYIGEGSAHDLTLLKQMNLKQLPPKTRLYGDAAYLSHPLEKKLALSGIRLIAARRRNTRHPLDLQDWLSLQSLRGGIETVFSRLASWMPRRIQAKTLKGFMKKICAFCAALRAEFCCT